MFKVNKPSIPILVLFFLVPVLVNAGDYLNGALLRAEGEVKVYLVKNNIKRWISTLEVFGLNNFKWQDVEVVSKKEITEIVEGEPIVKESSPSPTPVVSPSLVPPLPAAKINDKLPPPEYLRADWLVSHITANYGRVGQKLIFKYSTKESYKIENFRLYEKKPGDEYFRRIAEFEEVPSTGCEDIDIDGEWMITEVGQCGYWAIQRVVPPGGRNMVAYLPVADLPVGEYAYYVVGVDKDGLETPASPEAKLVFLNTVSILSPVDNQPVSSVYPVFEWTVANSWPAGSVADYFIMISDDANALNPLWTKQWKAFLGETKKRLDYDGLNLSSSKKYKVNIYGHYRNSEYDPDYISIPTNIPEFWVKSSGGWSLVKKIFAAILRLVDF